jgi:nucleoside-diphosphate-sugar epimerase
MKALVTGGTGFIGSHLCEALVKRGYQVRCLSRKGSNLKWIENLNIEICRGDCEQRDSLSSSIRDADYIFHLAGITKARSEREFFAVNAAGTENLIASVAALNPSLKRFVLLSSLAASGPSTDGTPVSENSEENPVSIYGRSKREGERAVRRYMDSLPVTIIRPPAVYGPRDRDLLVMFKMLKRGVFDLGHCNYSLVYVEDLVEGIIKAAEHPSALGKTYFLSGKDFYSGAAIAQEVCTALNVRAVPLKVPRFIMPFVAFIGGKVNKRGIINMDKMRELKYMHWICDSAKAREEMGFSPAVTLKEGIKWTADWYRIHRWL